MKKSLFYSFVFALATASRLLGETLSTEGFTHIDCMVEAIAPYSAHDHQHLHPHEHGTSPHQQILESSSLNWSGYAAAPTLINPALHSVTYVTGSWTVPRIHSSSTPHTYSSLWVGIDGYSDNTVEQIGTEQDWVSGKQQNYAWFEMYPNYAYELLGFPVNVGDYIRADVLYTGNNTFQLRIFNETRNVYFVIPSSYTKSNSAQRTSAEWIAEAPSSSQGVLPLANFGTVAFSQCTATISNNAGGINNKHWAHDSLTMVTPSHAVKAIPSGLTPDGQGFSVTWEHE